MNNKLHMAFATNLKWLNFVQRAIYDIIIRKSKETNITFYVLLDRIKNCHDFDIFNSIENINVISISLDSRKEFPYAKKYIQSWHDYFGYLRLLIPDLDIFKNIERVLYLDVDVLARKDLSDIYNVDLGDKAFGCIKDCWHIGYEDKNQYITSNGVDTGLIVMDIQKMKNICFTKRSKVNIQSVSSDQYMVNNYFLQDNKYLDIRYQIPVHYITNNLNVFKDISSWNCFFHTKYESTEELIKESYTWHFRGDKDKMYKQYPIVKTAFDLSEKRLNDFLLSKQVMQWKPEDDNILMSYL